MLQPLGLGIRSRSIVVALVVSVVALGVLLVCGLLLGFGVVGVVVGLGAGAMAGAFAATVLGPWSLAPLKAIADRRRRDAVKAARSSQAPEAVVNDLLDDIDARERRAAELEGRLAAVDAERIAERARDTERAAAREKAESEAAEQAKKLDRSLRLHELVVEPILNQLGRAIERVISVDSQVQAARPLLRVARAAVLWAEEAVETLGRLDTSEGETKEPFSLRDEIGTVARAISLGLGREVSIHFGADFPPHGTTHRTRLRLALIAVARWIAHRDPDGEIAIEADFVDAVQSDVPGAGHVRITVDARPVATATLGPADASAHPDIAAFGALIAPGGGLMLVGHELQRLGFLVAAHRHKRTNAQTLYGVGSLSDRSVLVIDARQRGRALLCEQLVAWRMTPTATADMRAAIEALELAERARKPFEVVVVCPRVPGMRSDGTPPELVEIARNAAFKGKKIVSLESFETLTSALPDKVAALEPHRLARPAPPLELLEALTLLLAPRPGTRAQAADKPRGDGALSVLVVEDNAVNQALLAKMLERRGHQATLTANGADAVDRLQESPNGFDVVLMDIQMPVMDGYEATSVIRMREAQDHLPRIPIIAVTAHAMSGERDKCIDAGMDGYLSKPVGEAELMTLIAETVRRVRAESSPDEELAPASSKAPAVFDTQRILEFAAGDQAFLRTLVDIFCETTPRQIGAIEGALAQNDAGALMRAAHQLKGSVGNFAAERAKKLAGDLEDAGRRRDFAIAESIMPQLKDELDALRTGLQRLV